MILMLHFGYEDGQENENERGDDDGDGDDDDDDKEILKHTCKNVCCGSLAFIYLFFLTLLFISGKVC